MRKRRFLFLLPTAFLLTGCNIDISAEEFGAKLIPNWISFVVQFAALLVIIVLVIVLGYKPIKRILNKRKDYVEQNIKDSEDAKAKWEANEEKSKQHILESSKEAMTIVSDARKEAFEVKSQMLADAQIEVDKMKQKAEQDIEKMKLEAKEEIRKEMIEVALDASKEVLKREVNTKDNARLVKEFIEEVEK